MHQAPRVADEQNRPYSLSTNKEELWNHQVGDFKTMSRLILVIFFLFITSAFAVENDTTVESHQKRVALVIGNGAYTRLNDQLPNPANDARAMAASLRALGLEVIEAIDLDYIGMRQALRRFDRALQGAEAGIFYYAGHGMEYRGQNYLFPTDAILETEGDVGLGLIDMDQILRVMETAVPTRLVFLDACRNNPMASQFRGTPGSSRSTTVGRGLGRMSAALGTFIAYATAPGEIAADGKGENSPFTTAMVQHLTEPGLEISQLMHKVRNSVIEATQEQQIPWESSSLRGPFVLNTNIDVNPPTPKVATPPSNDDQRAEILFWESIKDSDRLAAFEAYLDRFGDDGVFAPLAKDRLNILQPTQSKPLDASPNVDWQGIQEALNALGYDVGEADGIFGPRTRSALRDWQRGNGLTSDGYLTDNQVNRLTAEARPRLTAHKAKIRKQQKEQAALRQSSSVLSASRASTDPLTARQKLTRDLLSLQRGKTILSNHLEAKDFDLAKEMAEEGDALASTLVGFAYYYGSYVSQSDSKARTFFDMACGKGIARACHVFAYLLEEGRGGSSDYREARTLYKKACDNDVVQACTNLGRLHYRGRGIAKDYRRARDFYLMGCEGNHPKACVDLGWLYDNGLGVTKDYTKARIYYEKGCDGGHPRGCINLGSIYDQGLSIAKNHSKAKLLYEKACNSDNMYGCNNLGSLYRKGNGVAKDYDQARVLYQKACNNDHAGGCNNLGYLYRKGLGVKKNFVKARGFYQGTCDDGDMAGCTNLGWVHEAGLGVAKDYGKAADLYRKACDEDHARGCDDLAYLYKNGLGLEQDENLARTFYQRACTLEDDQTCDRLKK